MTEAQCGVFVDLCPHCQTKVESSKRPKTVKPIFSDDYGHRGQIDLIDMSMQPDGDSKWIGVYQDHFTKFCILFPLKSKSAANVGEALWTGK